CALRADPGVVRTCSAKTPIPLDGVDAGSKAVMVAMNRAIPSASRASVAVRNAFDDSEVIVVWAGTTRVDRGPVADLSARSSVAAPPGTGPTRRMEQCTSRSWPDRTPSARKSAASSRAARLAGADDETGLAGTNLAGRLARADLAGSRGIGKRRG